jgi:hypothetical protein
MSIRKLDKFSKLEQVNARIRAEDKAKLDEKYVPRTNTLTHQIIEIIDWFYEYSTSSYKKREDIPSIKGVCEKRTTTRLPKETIQKVQKIQKHIQSLLGGNKKLIRAYGSFSTTVALALQKYFILNN